MQKIELKFTLRIEPASKFDHDTYSPSKILDSVLKAASAGFDNSDDFVLKHSKAQIKYLKQEGNAKTR